MSKSATSISTHTLTYDDSKKLVRKGKVDIGVAPKNALIDFLN